MGIFLVFFPEKQHQHLILKNTNSNQIFTKTQSTISVCILLIFLTLLVFTLSSFEPNDVVSSHPRFLSQNTLNIKPPNSPALQGLGTLYVRGTSVTDGLVICHVSSSVTTDELKLFVRTFLRSGLPSKSDLVFVFNSISTIDSFGFVIREEIDTFLKLVRRSIVNGSQIVDFPASFDPTRFVKTGQDSDRGEPIWGKRVRIENNDSSSFGDVASELTQLSYGSVVGFGIGELDPDNSLSGLLDRVPMDLRRWACYPMILGRVKRKFKRVMLVDVKEVLLLGDPLGRIKSPSAESVIFSSTTEQKHGRKVNKLNKLNKSHRKVIDPTLILGGERGVRRLSAAMLTEIVRSTTRQHHKHNSVTESALLSQLASNEFLQKSIRFITTESIPDPSQLSGGELANMTVVRSGNSNLDIGLVIMKHICSFPIESSVYTEC
ncbi:uncharacterized protein LOC143634194 [Bidens hawaiensis]|uniref:uncharacterized protein LOC143634194 n=1 Tax=Bidens hawaiensis TaxID=980011 RepID=UPI00404A62FA